MKAAKEKINPESVGIQCIYRYGASTVAIVHWAAKAVRADDSKAFKCLAS
jgi:hypothetical protein